VREEPQFYDINTLDWVRLDEPPLVHGVDARLLSRDRELARYTVMTRFPAGWRASHAADDATLELLVLEGDVALEGDRVGAGGYLFVPEGSGTCDLRSEQGALALVYWSYALPLGDGAAVRVTRLWQEPWQTQVMTNMPHGAIAKSLRLPDVGDGPVHGGPGGMLRMILLPPGYADAQEHKHNCWEGLVFLAGDLIMPPRGVIGPGTYLGNPAEFWHAPMASQFGSLVLVQTDEPVVQPPRPYEGGQELVNGYRDTYSWWQQPQHREWADLPDYAAHGQGTVWSDLTNPNAIRPRIGADV
jgi:hypothetical protein